MGLFDRLKDGLGRSRKALGEGISQIFSRGRLDAGQIQSLEEVLLTADLGFDATQHIIAQLTQTGLNTIDDPLALRRALAREITDILSPVAQPLHMNPQARPHIILMAGVNGAGKTTTIAKLAEKYKNEGRKVMLAAGDTFRAAAIEQLQVWGDRIGVPVITTTPGGDAAGLAFSAIEQARAQHADILIFDTAGRLQSNEALMAELEKIVRVMRKLEPDAPHSALLVLDATVGQNALSQAKAFRAAASITGLIMTKLDGTARGGVLVALASQLNLPIHYIGVGEQADDLQVFNAEDFAHALVGLNRDGEQG